MTAPTNPKKRPLMGASKLRKALRAAGHRLNPIVQIGKEGVTAGVLAQLSEALDHHELVKVRVGTESPEDRFDAAGRIQAEGTVQVAQILGRTILAYRQHATAPRFEPLARPPADRSGDDATALGRRAPSAPRARPESRSSKAAPSRSREEFWQRKVAASGGSRDPRVKRRVWTEKPPRKEVPKGPPGHAKELGRRSPKVPGPRGRPAGDRPGKRPGKRPPRGR
jgi:RNA-binding protein